MHDRYLNRNLSSFREQDRLERRQRCPEEPRETEQRSRENRGRPQNVPHTGSQGLRRMLGQEPQRNRKRLRHSREGCRKLQEAEAKEQVLGLHSQMLKKAGNPVLIAEREFFACFRRP